MLNVFRSGGKLRQVVEREGSVLAQSVSVIICRCQTSQACPHQLIAALLALGSRGLQLIAERHQFVNLGYDAVLFGKRREGQKDVPNRVTI
ncbi:hypothetical protein AQ715_21480 [Burkholderia pseudomallei]|nr:hypothetical protein AQ715_21480 [Burkholderia pseudomallei]